MNAQEYIHNILQAIIANSYAHAFYFPTDRSERRIQNLRLAREIGVGLVGLDGANNIIQGLYSSLIVRLSFDRTGVCIDARDFFAEMRQSMLAEEHKSTHHPQSVISGVNSSHPEYHQGSLWETPHTQTQDHLAGQVSP